MCDAGLAIGAVVAAISAATSIYQVQQQQKQAKAANKAAELQYQTEVDRANRDAKNRQGSLTHKGFEEASDFAQRREKLKLEALRAQSAARAASAESGVGGVTTVRSFIAETISEDLARSDIERSQEVSQFNINQQARGIGIDRADRIHNAGFTRASNYRRVPTGLDVGLAGASGAASGFASGYSLGSSFGGGGGGRKKASSKSSSK